MRDTENIRSDIRRRIAVIGEQHKLAQNDTHNKAYARVLLSDTPTQTPNVIQRQRGIDATTHMYSEVLYLTMIIMHIPLIQQELTFRGEPFKELWSIKKLVDYLRESNIVAQKIAIEGESGCIVDNNKLNCKSFLPFATTADRYWVET